MRFAVLALAAATALASLDPASAAEKVRLAQNQAPISGVSIVADRKGFFAKNGLEVEVFNFTTGKQCLDTVMGGGADIATTAEAPTTAAAMSGQKIAFLTRTEYSYIKTLTATGAGIRKPADLKGKRIAFTAGTGGEVYTMQLLKVARPEQGRRHPGQSAPAGHGRGARERQHRRLRHLGAAHLQWHQSARRQGDSSSTPRASMRRPSTSS